ncbi:hypothetical protein O3P69_008095 [Scylla paramamosain]|uniref:SAM domain-containing protein n=1 Tax=Scylla paramamosain TaxID=85552 RepID=A0AAW0T3S3_SCYPA
MERGLPLLPASVIEGVLDVTTVYYITIETRDSDRPTPLYSSCQVSPVQRTTASKNRPVATVRPFSATGKGEQQKHETLFDSEFEEKDIKQSTLYEDFGEEDEDFSNENTVEYSSCDSGEVSDSCSAAKFDSSCEPQEEDRAFPSPVQPIEETPPSPQLPRPRLQSLPTPPPSSSPSPSPSPPSETKPQSQVTGPQENPDPCRCHREKLRAVLGKLSTFSTGRMEVCQNGGECHEGQGCNTDFVASLKESRSKETCLTECLDEFLEELQLTHLRDYLKVLGCTCVRDLKLLEEPELNAIQLVSRRRLLQRLENMSLHHESPPSDCSLEGWLTWYGLTHIAGFLNAIGVLTVGDMSYLKEEDLELLKPVTRRRILSLYRK